MVSERDDERVAERIRSEGRQLSAVLEEAASTPQPEATSFDHGIGLLSHAREDVLLSLLANQRGLFAQRMLLQGHGPGELGGGAKHRAGSGGMEESGGCYWSLGRPPGASSESVTLARHVSDNFVDFLQLHQMTLLIS